MLRKFDHEIFLRVFSDARVIDVGFSEWTKQIAFWVLADHYEEWLGQPCPLVIIKFEEVCSFSCKMPPFEDEAGMVNSCRLSSAVVLSVIMKFYKNLLRLKFILGNLTIHLSLLLSVSQSHFIENQPN